MIVIVGAQVLAYLLLTQLTVFAPGGSLAPPATLLPAGVMGRRLGRRGAVADGGAGAGHGIAGSAGADY